MIVYRIEILVREAFVTIGYVRRDYYSNRAAIEMTATIPELWQQTIGHGINTHLVTWNDAHENGDSITSWTWRARTW